MPKANPQTKARPARLASPLAGLPFRRYSAWLAAGALGSLHGHLAAQDALRYSMAGQASVEAMRLQLENQPASFKSGDFRLLVSPSLGLDYNDNINISRDAGQSDVILKPFVQFNASYPIGQRNLLQLDVGLGYDAYLDHHSYSGLRLHSGSQVAFDVFTGDFRFDIHDRFEYIGDSAGVAAATGNTQYEYFQNIAGLSVDWDLQDVVFTLGYDHLNYLSASSFYDYLNHATEMVLARAGLKIHPQLTVGVEGTAAPTTYDQHVLNNNVAYSAGAYATWNPGHNFSLTPRAGYSMYDFQQTSLFVLAKDSDTYYADITLQHQATAAIRYNLSCGHEVKLGIQSDLIEDTYLRPSLTWNILENVSLHGGVFYEHGTQKGATAGQGSDFDWYGGTIGANWSFMKNLQAGLNYRVTQRSSNQGSQEYTQNLVGLLITYTPR